MSRIHNIFVGTSTCNLHHAYAHKSNPKQDAQMAIDSLKITLQSKGCLGNEWVLGKLFLISLEVCNTQYKDSSIY